MHSDWLAGPGQFWILGLSWGSVAVFYLCLAWKMGRAIQSETDGCLLMICNLLLVIIGGNAGLLILKFPYNLLCSMFLALALPTAVTLFWHRRTAARKRP